MGVEVRVFQYDRKYWRAILHSEQLAEQQILPIFSQKYRSLRYYHYINDFDDYDDELDDVNHGWKTKRECLAFVRNHMNLYGKREYGFGSTHYKGVFKKII